MEIEFSIWIASTTRWTHLTKVIALPVVPRVDEFVKFRNAIQGEYFAWKVTQVTYHEAGTIEVMTELLNDIDSRGFSFEDEAEFDEYIRSYLAEGWVCDRGIRPNPHTTEPARRTQQGHISDI